MGCMHCGRIYWLLLRILCLMLLLYTVLRRRRIGHVLLLSTVLIGLCKSRKIGAPCHMTWYLTVGVAARIARTRSKGIFSFALKMKREKILSCCMTSCCVVRSLTLIVFLPSERSSINKKPAQIEVPILGCVVQRCIALLVNEINTHTYTKIKHKLESDDTWSTSTPTLTGLISTQISVN